MVSFYRTHVVNFC